MKIAFSLLHYNNIAVTKEAIDYLKKLNGIEDTEIIIVDNHSPNKSGELLKDEYKTEANIHVILNSENSGFAKGNNIGYKYAVDNLKSDTVVVMNNDVFIKDTDFINKLKRSVSNNSGAQIIAPSIIGKQGNQNPLRCDLISQKKLKRIHCYNAIIAILYSIPGVAALTARCLDKRKKNKKTVVVDSKIKRCVPHGACVIYTDSWTKSEPYAFLPITFMYFEEDILAQYVDNKSYYVAYDADLEVFHVEDASVDSFNKTSLKKRKFIARNMRTSTKALLKFRKGN